MMTSTPLSTQYSLPAMQQNARQNISNWLQALIQRAAYFNSVDVMCNRVRIPCHGNPVDGLMLQDELVSQPLVLGLGIQQAPVMANVPVI